MRKSDADRRTFLNNFKLRMVEIENASDARLGDLQVSESQIDAILSRSDAAGVQDTALSSSELVARERVHA